MRVQGPRTNEFKQFHWWKALNWSPRLLDEGPRPKSGKLRLNLHGTCFGGKINWFRPNQFASNQSKLVHRKLDVGPSSKVGRSITTSKIKFGNIMPQPCQIANIWSTSMHVKGNNKFDNLTWLTRTCRAFVVLPPFHMCSPTNLGFSLLHATNDDQIFFFFSYVPIWFSIVCHYLCQCQI
jgi:hypothetical protein